MRDRYGPPPEPGGPAAPGGHSGPAGSWDPSGHPTRQPVHRWADPYDDFATRADEAAAGTRAAGLRRLSRLTWRSIQLGALATVGFVTLFARSAPAQTAGSAAVTAPVTPAASPSLTPQPAATAPSPSPSSTPTSGAASAPAATPPASSPTLAPPATTPAAAPPAPAPVHSTSSGSHGG